MIESCSTK